MNDVSWLKDLSTVGILAVALVIMGFIIYKLVCVKLEKSMISNQPGCTQNGKNGGGQAQQDQSIDRVDDSTKDAHKRLDSYLDKCNETHKKIEYWMGKTDEKLGNLVNEQKMMREEVTQIRDKIMGQV